MAVRAAFALRNMCVKAITAPEMNRTNSATLEEERSWSNEDRTACTQNGRTMVLERLVGVIDWVYSTKLT
jgi:hypothetical protein